MAYNIDFKVNNEIFNVSIDELTLYEKLKSKYMHTGDLGFWGYSSVNVWKNVENFMSRNQYRVKKTTLEFPYTVWKYVIIISFTAFCIWCYTCLKKIFELSGLKWPTVIFFYD